MSAAALDVEVVDTDLQHGDRVRYAVSRGDPHGAEGWQRAAAMRVGDAPSP